MVDMLASVSYCRICFSMGDLGRQVSLRPSFPSFVHPSVHPGEHLEVWGVYFCPRLGLFH